MLINKTYHDKMCEYFLMNKDNSFFCFPKKRFSWPLGDNDDIYTRLNHIIHCYQDSSMVLMNLHEIYIVAHPRTH